jgi:APA family basic amino acid/polyamine antiporter
MVGNHFTPFLVASGSVGRQGLTLLEGITAAIGLTLWAFIGLESATVPAEEVKDPKRTIPRATYLGTAVTTLIYIVATVAVMGIIPLAALSNSNAPFADAATTIWGGTWGKWVGLVGMISAFGALNGWTLLTARISLAASQDGLFPKVFGRVHGTRRTPIYGLIIAAVLVTGLVFMNYTESLVDQFTFMLLLATLTTVVPYAFAAAAEIALMIKEPERFAGHNLLRDTLVAIFGFGYAVWAMYATGSEAIAKGYILLMLGIPIFLYLRWRRQRDRLPLRTELEELPEKLTETPVALAQRSG